MGEGKKAPTHLAAGIRTVYRKRYNGFVRIARLRETICTRKHVIMH